MRLKFAFGIALLALCMRPGIGQEFPSFETAAVHPVSHPSPNEGRSMVDLADARRFRAVNADLSELIEWAYEVRGDRISGPADIHSKIFTFDIEATVPEQVDKVRARLMLRRLLAERFGVALHSVSKPTSGYLLVVDNGGPKLKASELENRKSIMAYGRPSTVQLISPAGRMESLADSISRSIEMPVLDQTHLDGLYDINIQFARIGPVDSDAPTVFAAVKQVGLRLDKAQIPIETIVVERANFRPGGN